MTLDFTSPGVLKVDMTTYVNKMLQEFPEQLDGKTKRPCNKNLYKVDESSSKLDEQKAKIFHTFVMKSMFLCKQARQDVLPGIICLTTRVLDSRL